MEQLCVHLESQGKKRFKLRDLLKALTQLSGAKSLSDEVLDCVYVMLCRGVAFNELQSLNDQQLLESLRGFKAPSVRSLLGLAT